MMADKTTIKRVRGQFRKAGQAEKLGYLSIFSNFIRDELEKCVGENNYHLNNLKYVENTGGGVLPLLKLQATIQRNKKNTYEGGS